MTGEAFRSMMLTFLEGFGVSLELFGITLLVSIPLGFVIALGRISKYKIISWPLSVYISIMRGTPLLLQLLFFSFGPFYMFGWNWNRFLAVCISFSLIMPLILQKFSVAALHPCQSANTKRLLLLDLGGDKPSSALFYLRS